MIKVFFLGKKHFFLKKKNILQITHFVQVFFQDHLIS